MDDLADDLLAWSPRPGLVAIAWVAAVAAAAWALFPSAAVDPPSRLIGGTAAMALAVTALWGTRARPRLRADRDGITVRGLGGAQHYPWSSVERAHVVRTKRWGRDVALLEIDVASEDVERLLVFGRLDLGTDPDDVAERLAKVRPTGGR